MSEGPIAWWKPSPGKRPLWQTFAGMRDAGLTAVGGLLRAHPTQRIWENIRRAFRTPGIDVIVVTPLHWASTEVNWDMTIDNLRWENLPENIFELLYRHYGGQDKAIIVQTLELDWTVAGIGCRQDDRCIRDDGRYAHYLKACQEGTLAPYWQCEGQVGCETIASSMVKLDRAAYLLGVCNRLQAAAEAARANHPNAKLKVFYSMEVNFFRNEFYLVARDLIPKMPAPPDFVGLSLYKKAGDHVKAFENVLEWTGLPAERVFISEVGAREGTQRDGSFISGTPQADRINSVVNDLFGLGCPLAMVWSWEEIPYTGGHTGYAVNDAVTKEPLSGRKAIRDLNAHWRT
jgi:hypothetical protein